jgi:hypothetical protein
MIHPTANRSALLLAALSCALALAPSASAGTVASEHQCPTASGSAPGVLIAGTVCVANPGWAVDEEVQENLVKVSDTYQLWTEDPYPIFRAQASDNACEGEDPYASHRTGVYLPALVWDPVVEAAGGENDHGTHICMLGPAEWAFGFTFEAISSV